jgi:LPXTG-motif cell wall-anchored protein
MPPLRRLLPAIALIGLPMPLALTALVLGLVTTSLPLVYASIALSALGVPAFVAGVFLLVRRRREDRPPSPY